ncbi:hypothetical protein BDV24DRAFT_43686 [Aspergillus arachidicola]|uniref:Uncharacterized protein n=1 Tax=Aspergillus arachidicola TaxID=656916 RepID=A0A5N6YFE0_9EURO|nr:hypothetical protein BDV24DRAFT_43686 [Aspergillus arachidicola]
MKKCRMHVDAPMVPTISPPLLALIISFLSFSCGLSMVRLGPDDPNAPRYCVIRTKRSCIHTKYIAAFPLVEFPTQPHRVTKGAALGLSFPTCRFLETSTTFGDTKAKMERQAIPLATIIKEALIYCHMNYV